MPVSTGMFLFLEAFAMFVALLGSHVIVTGPDSWQLLTISVAGLLGVAACCLAIFRRGRTLRRFAVAVAVPTIVVITDWFFRLPHMLGLM